MGKEKLDPNDISGKMFAQALAKALAKCDGSIMCLSVKLGLKSRCAAWVEGHFPPYEKMKSVYFQCLDIINGK